MTEKLLKTSSGFILAIKINKSKLNFPLGVKVQAANLSFKVHYEGGEVVYIRTKACSNLTKHLDVIPPSSKLKTIYF